MMEPREWPFEKSAKGSLRPWFLSTRGFIAVLFGDADEAEQAVGGLCERGVSEEDMRLNSANQVLDTNILSSMQEDRSVLAAALVAFYRRPAGQAAVPGQRVGGWLDPLAFRPDRGPSQPPHPTPRRLSLFARPLLRRRRHS